MTEFSGSFNRQQYLRELRHGVEDHEAIVAEFARGWEYYQHGNGLSVVRFTDEFEAELEETLHRSHLQMGHLLDRKYEESAQSYADAHPNSTTAQMLTEPPYLTHTRFDKLYRDRADEEEFFPTLLYFRNLGTQMYGLICQKGPEAAFDKLATIEIDEQLKAALHRMFNAAIYRKAKYDKDIPRGASTIRFASSEVAVDALRSAFDHRLLRKAVQKRADEESRDMLIDLASTPRARDIMLGELAIRSKTGKWNVERPESEWYAPVISESFVADLKAKQFDRLEDRIETLERLLQAQLRRS